MAPSFPFFFFLSSITPSSLTHTNAADYPFSPKPHSQAYFARGSFLVEMVNKRGSGKLRVIRAVNAHSQILLLEKLRMTDSDTPRFFFFFTPAPFYQPTSVVLSFCRSFHTSVGSSRDIKFWPSCNDQTMVHCDISLSLNETGEKQFIVATLFCYTHTNTHTHKYINISLATLLGTPR